MDLTYIALPVITVMFILLAVGIANTKEVEHRKVGPKDLMDALKDIEFPSVHVIERTGQSIHETDLISMDEYLVFIKYARKDMIDRLIEDGSLRELDNGVLFIVRDIVEHISTMDEYVK